jgi:outer membrane protein assembly factor BamE (lipoprotein component of BamABCDE complex)
MKRSSFTLALCLSLLAVNTGCVRTHQTRGSYVTEERLAQVQPGMNHDGVAKILGTPSFQGLFKDDTWYYYGVKESTVAFLSPRIDETRLIKITFDKDQHVTAIETPPSGIDQSIQ